MARLELEGLSKHFGSTVAVRDVSLDVRDGEFLVLLGPSGCGKTTTLRMIAGFIAPSAGRVRLDGEDVTALPPWKRNAGMVFQSYALFPHLTVGENVAFGLEMRKVPRAEMSPRVAEALRLVRLGGLSERLPRQLSGGQQQRVALARALVIRPDVLLLDEPLSNLDAKLRETVRVEIRELQHDLGITTVMVTHDQEEALIMADRLVVMSEGSVRQVGSQRDLYERPADSFVAGFVGRSNLLAGAVVGPGRFQTDGGLSIACVDGTPGPGVIALRPERLVLGAAAAALDNRVSGTVELVSYLGSSIDKAKKALLDLKKLKPRIYPSNEALAQALQTEEVGLCIMWKARAVQWQNAGANILTVAPKEGIITYVSGFAIPKNAPNREGSYAFLDAAMEASAQEGFAIDMGYNPVVANAKVAPDLKKRIGFGSEEEKLFVNPDLAFLAKHAADVKDFWDKEFKAA